jgi:hypothetical protein
MNIVFALGLGWVGPVRNPERFSLLYVLVIYRNPYYAPWGGVCFVDIPLFEPTFISNLTIPTTEYEHDPTDGLAVRDR